MICQEVVHEPVAWASSFRRDLSALLVRSSVERWAPLYWSWCLSWSRKGRSTLRGLSSIKHSAREVVFVEEIFSRCGLVEVTPEHYGCCTSA